MSNFERAHNQYLEPPDDDPVCEFCGETLVPDINADWFCNNRFCPAQFGEGTVEYRMAELILELKEESSRWKNGYRQLKDKYNDTALRLSAALENTIIHKCRSCEGYYNKGWVCSCGRDNSYSDAEWEERKKENNK